MAHQPMPEYKPLPTRLVRFVEVPRAHVDAYAQRPWAEVITAAQQQRDGLRIIDANFFGAPQPTPETAWLRENPDGGCFLFCQNWIADDAIVYKHYLS